jgi:cyclophilin family peptidyl-prolyl cis-trans isomerase
METSIGNLTIEIFMDECPITAGNFMNLSEDGFYDGLKFHRVLDDFMIQGGDPNADGTGGPGYTIPDEASALSLHHRYGAVSMANSGPNTAGSQFFIICSETGSGHLDGQHAIFGQVITGMDIATSISRVATDSSDKPLIDVIIEEINVPDIRAPVIVLVEWIETNEGALVTLDGSGSSDNVGIVNWTWEVPYGGTTIYLYGPTHDFQFDKSGKYPVFLTVRDAAGNTATGDVIVSIKSNDQESPGFLGFTLLSVLCVMSIQMARCRNR